jgi:hypothetical protein
MTWVQGASCVGRAAARNSTVDLCALFSPSVNIRRVCFSREMPSSPRRGSHRDPVGLMMAVTESA